MGWRERLGDERGFTLIELLCATAAGLIVSAAVLAILVSSFQLSSGDADRVDANQQGRVAMERIVQALNSSCVAGQGVSPIVGTGTTTGGGAASGADSVAFYSSLSDAATVDPNEIVVALSGGALTMSTYNYLSGNAPNFTFATTPASTVTLIPHAALVSGTSAVFSYYGYDPTTETLTDQYDPGSGTLSSGQAADTSEVAIAFESQPSNADSTINTGVSLSDSVVLRLTPVSDNVASSDSSSPGPCT
jgi:prepilin-type N-terminal cleavage/methylation domain-containing protein